MTVFIVLAWAALGQVGVEAPPPLPQGPLPASPVGDDLQSTPSAAPTGEPTLRPAEITVENDVVIAAEAEGTLIKLPVREGDQVDAGQVLATIDDRQAVAGREIARIGHEAALARADDAVEETFAIASAAFAKIDLEKDLRANQGAPGSVTEIQIEQKRLAYKRARLQIEKAQKDREIAAKEADVKKAELSAADIQLEERTIRAPLAGEVQQVFQKQSQWVKPGDPIVRLVQYDTLRVEAAAPAALFDPADLAGRRVTVTAHLARGRTASLEGRIVFVDQTVLLGKYRVRAEVQNVREAGYWVLRPGLDAEMTIHTNEPAVETARH